MLLPFGTALGQTAPAISYAGAPYSSLQGTVVSGTPANSGGTIPAGQVYSSVTTFAGSAGLAGSANGTGSAARFSSPAMMTSDGSGNIYVCDAGNGLIRQITSAGVVTTLADKAGFNTSDLDGTGTAATFNNPKGIVCDPTGTYLYIAMQTL